jgi:hypothetical protein
MDCRTVYDHLSTYLDHDLPLQMRVLFDHHLAACPQCRHELAQLHTVTAWVRDFPRIDPSPVFLQQVRERVGRLPHRSRLPWFRRLAGTLPVQAAAALVVVVSAALIWQMMPSLRHGQEAEPPARTAPWISHERSLTPILDAPSFEPTPEEPFPAPPPLVQLPLRRPGFMAREGFVRFGSDASPMPMPTGMPAEERVGEVSRVPSLTLRADDPVQAAQQIWELVPRTGGALLQSQGMITPAGRTSRGPVKVALSIAADRYQTLIDAIRQVPGSTVTEERMAIISRELSPGSTASLWRIEHAHVTKAPPTTLVITILPR